MVAMEIHTNSDLLQFLGSGRGLAIWQNRKCCRKVSRGGPKPPTLVTKQPLADTSGQQSTGVCWKTIQNVD